MPDEPAAPAPETPKSFAKGDSVRVQRDGHIVHNPIEEAAPADAKSVLVRGLGRVPVEKLIRC